MLLTQSAYNALHVHVFVIAIAFNSLYSQPKQFQWLAPLLEGWKLY